jgi:hypothetical protein
MMFVDKHIVKLADRKSDQDQLADIFIQTFKLLYDAAGNNALRRYDKASKKFTGFVGQVALEAVAVGVARNYRAIQKTTDPAGFVLRKIKSFWSEERVRTFSSSGVSGTKRLSETIDYGQEYFSP